MTGRLDLNVWSAQITLQTKIFGMNKNIVRQYPNDVLAQMDCMETTNRIVIYGDL